MEAPQQPQPPAPPAWEAHFTPVAEPLNEGYHRFGIDRPTEEVELTGCALEELSSKGVTWESFHDFLTLPNKNGQHRRLVSVAPGVFLSFIHGGTPNIDDYMSSSGCTNACGLGPFGGGAGGVFIWTADGYGYERAISSCDFILGLLAETDRPNTIVFGSEDGSPCPVSGSAIANYLTKSNDNLTKIFFQKCTMEQGHFRGFANAPVKEEVKIMLNQCIIDASVSSSFLDCVQKGRGPRHLLNCVIDPIVLGQALTTSNCRITTLEIGMLELNDHSLLTILRAVASNKSLLEFDAQGMHISDDNLPIFCQSFRAHPALLHLKFELNRQPDLLAGNPDADSMSAERIERRMNDVLALLHVNSVLEQVELWDPFSFEPPLPQNLLDKIESRLVMNRSAFDEQCQSLGPVAHGLRPKLLGRALHMARLNPKLLWKFLSKHVDTVAEAADARIFDNLDAAAQQRRRQVDRREAQMEWDRPAPWTKLLSYLPFPRQHG